MPRSSALVPHLTASRTYDRHPVADSTLIWAPFCDFPTSTSIRYNHSRLFQKRIDCHSTWRSRRESSRSRRIFQRSRRYLGQAPFVERRQTTRPRPDRPTGASEVDAWLPCGLLPSPNNKKRGHTGESSVACGSLGTKWIPYPAEIRTCVPFPCYAFSKIRQTACGAVSKLEVSHSYGAAARLARHASAKRSPQSRPLRR